MNSPENTWPNLDETILRLLLKSHPNYLDAQAFCHAIPGITVEVVKHRLHHLQQLGLGLEHLPPLGYRWGSPQDFLWADEILARLSLSRSEGIVPWRFLCLQETDSTNDIALQAARRGEVAGLVVTANRQRAGRGRLGRRWVSDQAAGLYVSLLLRPDWEIRHLTRLTILSGLAAAEAVESCCRHSVQLKWPNDLMVNGSKLGGILVEALCQKGRIEAAVIGLGLNLRQTADDFPEELRNTATSLFQVTGQHWRRAELLTALLLKFESLLMESPEALQERWSARCLSLGKMLTVHTPEGPRHGQALGLDPEGCLLLRLDSGTIQRIQVGDVLP